MKGNHVDRLARPVVRLSVRPTIHPIESPSERQSVQLAATTAAFGRATSFVVSFVVATNGADIVAVNTIFVLRLSKTGRTVGRTDSRLDGWSVGRTDE